MLWLLFVSIDWLGPNLSGFDGVNFFYAYPRSSPCDTMNGTTSHAPTADPGLVESGAENSLNLVSTVKILSVMHTNKDRQYAIRITIFSMKKHADQFTNDVKIYISNHIVNTYASRRITSFKIIRNLDYKISIKI